MPVRLAEYLARGASVAVHMPIRCGGGLISVRETGHDRQRSLLSDPKKPLEIRWPLQPKLSIFVIFDPQNLLEIR
jgi:hypothetical protein